MARILPRGEREGYQNAALCLLGAADAYCADWGLENPAILQKCTGAYHSPDGHHIGMTYGDYYFIEALGKLWGEALRFW